MEFNGNLVSENSDAKNKIQVFHAACPSTSLKLLTEVCGKVLQENDLINEKNQYYV